MKIRANSRLGYKFTVNWHITVNWQILTELRGKFILLKYINIIHNGIWLLDIKGRTWWNDIQTLLIELILILAICRCSRCRTLRLARGMNVSVGLSKCEGKLRLELLLRFVRGPGTSLGWCLFFNRRTSDSTLDARKFIRWNCRPTLPQDCYWRNKFIFVTINVGILSSLMFVTLQLIMTLSCSFNKMFRRTEIKILLPLRSDTN